MVVEQPVRMKAVPEIKDEQRRKLDQLRIKKLFDKSELEKYKFSNATKLLDDLVQNINNHKSADKHNDKIRLSYNRSVDNHVRQMQTQADTYGSGWFDHKSKRDRDTFPIAPSVFKTPSAIMFQTGFHLKPVSKPQLRMEPGFKELRIARVTGPVFPKY